MKTTTVPALSGYLAPVIAIALGSFTTLSATPELEPTGDLEVAEFVQMEIYHDSMMAGAEVEVVIDSGVATLSGTVRSLSQAERAATRLYSSPKVRAVVNSLKIVPGSPSKILSSASRKLDKQGMFDADNIYIKVHGTEVLLAGKVGTRDEAELAREIISEISGVTSVDNKIVVSSGGLRSDDQIARQLVFAVKSDPIFAGLDLVPQVTDGAVTWSGEVGGSDDISRLVRNSKITGVGTVSTSQVGINSDLKLEATEDKAYNPSQSMEALKIALQQNPSMEEATIRVSMEDGVLILNGTVSAVGQKESAELTARSIPGVRMVANGIVVGSERQLASHTHVMNLASASTEMPAGR